MSLLIDQVNNTLDGIQKAELLLPTLDPRGREAGLVRSRVIILRRRLQVILRVVDQYCAIAINPSMSPLPAMVRAAGGTAA